MRVEQLGARTRFTTRLQSRPHVLWFMLGMNLYNSSKQIPRLPTSTGRVKLGRSMKYKILIGLRLPLLPADRLENSKKSDFSIFFFFFKNLLNPVDPASRILIRVRDHYLHNISILFYFPLQTHFFFYILQRCKETEDEIFIQ